jgi:hypothetical protein
MVVSSVRGAISLFFKGLFWTQIKVPPREIEVS